MHFDNPNHTHSPGKNYNLMPKNVIASSYWKVPDPNASLTSIACHESDPFIAVTSASSDSNLFIYEVSSSPNPPITSPSSSTVTLYDTGSQSPSLDQYSHTNSSTDNLSFPDFSHQSKPSKHKHSTSISSDCSRSSDSTLFPDSTLNKSPVLIHHQTISLGGIHSLAWVPAKHTISTYGNVLATGHSGIVHLVRLPDPYTNNGPAEILSRFNHTPHISSSSLSSSSLEIKTINIANSIWKCCPESSIMSLFSQYLFMWDPSRNEIPILKQKVRKSISFHASPLRNGIISLATSRGISIMDIRYKNPAPLAPPTSNTGTVSLVKWSSIDENRVASVHDQKVVKIWDIRAGAPLMVLDGHVDKVNAIDWSSTNSNEFFSASSDGTVRLWDLQKCMDLDINGSSTENHYSLRSSCDLKDSSSDDWIPNKSWKLYRQRLAGENSVPSYNYFLDNIQNPDSPCTTIFSNKKEYIALGSVNLSFNSSMGSGTTKPVPQLITIDNDGFFGLHSRTPAPFEPIIEDDLEKPYYKSSKKKLKPRRHSMESLASATSKSGSSGESDLNLDDSFSDTSVSASSPTMSDPSSPIPESKPSSNITPNTSLAFTYSEESVPRKLNVNADSLAESVKTHNRKDTKFDYDSNDNSGRGETDLKYLSRYKKMQSYKQLAASSFDVDYLASVRPLNVNKSFSSTNISKRSISGGNIYYSCSHTNSPQPAHSATSIKDYNQVYTTLDPHEDFNRRYSQYHLPDTYHNNMNSKTRYKRSSNRRRSDIPVKEYQDKGYRFTITSTDG